MIHVNDLPTDKKIILYDGVCALCNRWVQWVIARDKQDTYRFVAQESDLGQRILKHIGVDTRQTDSIVLYQPGWAYYQKSQAVLEILNELTPAGLGAIPLRLVPGKLRDVLYDRVAKTRYAKYGKLDACPTPDPSIKHKFLY